MQGLELSGEHSRGRHLGGAEMGGVSTWGKEELAGAVRPFLEGGCGVERRGQLEDPRNTYSSGADGRKGPHRGTAEV